MVFHDDFESHAFHDFVSKTPDMTNMANMNDMTDMAGITRKGLTRLT